MKDHLSTEALNALADGELSDEALAQASEHLARCQGCTSEALAQTLLKRSVTRAGHRYAPPSQLLEKVTTQMASEQIVQQPAPVRATGNRFGALGWLAAAAVLLISVGSMFLQRTAMRSNRDVALLTEVSDQHIATLAANGPPQVLSTDRHTVKPWFQGKIPFSFNLPENLQADTKLDGANLTYLHNQPVAQLLYSVGKHRVSVFLRESAVAGKELPAERSGFHVRRFRKGELEGVAVSDVEAARLDELVAAIAEAQTGGR